MAVSEHPSLRPKHPSFTRRMATKVVSLIAKFEALNSTYPLSPDSPVPSRPSRPPESKLSSPRSISKYSGFSKTLSRKAGRMFTRLGQDNGNDGERVPVRGTPPRKRILQVAAPKRRRAWEWRKRSGEGEGVRTDGNFSQNEGDVLVNDDDDDEEAVGPESTPPPLMARVLPSSLLMQLVVSDDQKKKIEVGKRQFRLQPGVHPKQSMWRRKITPPKISVKELISRFKNSPEAEDPEELCVLGREVVDPRKKAADISVAVPDRLLPPLASSDGTTVFASARTTQFATGTKAPRLSLEAFTRNGRADTTPSDILKHPSPVPSLATPEPLNIRKEVGVTVAPLAIKKARTSSNSGSETSRTTVRIQESFSPSPELRPDTPPTRKYRKTPPSTGFFAKVRGAIPNNKEWGAPSLYTLSSDVSEASDETDLEEVEQQEENHEGSSTASEMSLPSGWSDSSEEGIMIGVGVSAVEIVQPRPHREMQTRKMLGLIRRYY